MLHGDDRRRRWRSGEIGSTGRSLGIVRATVLGFAATALIVLFFSPSWVSFAAWRAMPQQYGDLVAVRRAVAVVQQIADPTMEIRDPIHGIVRWRLLFPTLGHLLHVPPAAVLLLSPLGYVLVLSLLIRCAHRRGLPWLECTQMAIVVGCASWFFVATGWLGYFDSWLVLGLLVVSFSPAEGMILAACALTPLVDERFVLGFPLAMVVRWVDDERGGTTLSEFALWLLREAARPALVVLLIVAVRFSLIGRGGSDSLATYAHRVAFARLSVERLLWGAWEGLRVGWFLIGAAVVILAKRGNKFGALVLAVGVVMTTTAGLAIANDLSRSATLAITVVPLAWGVARTTAIWRRAGVRWALLVAALVLPAHHVVSDFILPVNGLWVELRLLADSGLVAVLRGS
jgi:hypothetical protein